MVNIKRNRRKGKEVNVEFSLPKATLFGGALPLFHYMKNIRLEQQFNEALTFTKASTAIYSLPQICVIQVAGRLLGKQRLFHFEEMEQDQFLAKELGLMSSKLPDTTILYKDLDRFDSEEKIQMLKQVNDQVHIRQLKKQQTVILDFDSSVETVYGKQKGACVGYNPRNHGKSSFHPLFCFDGVSHHCLNFKLREGDAYTSDGTIDLLEDTLMRLPDSSVTLYCRGDKGFGSETMYATCETKMIGYTIKVKKSKPLLKESLKRPWCRFYEGNQIIECTDFHYQAQTWSIPRRIVAIRTKELLDEDQTDLSSDSDWEYEWIVTNLVWDAEDIWRFYNHRCGMENYIKEAKNGFALDQISKDTFYPNEADALFKIIAYNVYQSFKQEVAHKETQSYTISRMRRTYWMIPAVLVYHARKWILRLWNGFARQSQWFAMLYRAKQIE